MRQQPPGYASTELLKILLLVPPGKEEIYIYIYVAPSSRKEEEQVGEINLCKCV